MDAFIGSIWFGVMLFAFGYIGGNILPLGKITSWISAKLG
jgi:hypothetical protein